MDNQRDIPLRPELAGEASPGSYGFRTDKREPANLGRAIFFQAINCFVSFPAMLGALLIARVFDYVRHNFFLDPDFWWHIKVGRDIWQTQYWPSTDIYSYTAYGTPWIAYEWFGELILSGVAGLGGVIPLFVLLVLVASCVTLAL